MLSLSLCASLLFLTISVLGGVGCSDEVDVENDSPQILELHTQKLVVGETLYLHGRNFSQTDYQTNKVFFEGTYTTDLGQVDPVSFGIIPVYDGEFEQDGTTFERLRINRLGPFRNPFNAQGRPGVFEGRIIALVEDDNGDSFSDVAPQVFRLEIGPSISITEFQPLFADCGEPAVRALEGIAYRFRVEVSGIAAVKYVYELNQVNDYTGVTNYVHEYPSPVDSDVIGESEPIFFNRIPDSDQSYVTSIRVKAYDREGNMTETALPLSVHRPLEIIYDGKRDIAQLYEPVPVSGCIPGSVGTRVNYSERKSEYRQRTVSMTVNQSWMRREGQNLSRSWREGVSEGQTSSRTLGSTASEEERLSESMNLNYNQSSSNSMNFSESDGETWRWSLSEGQTNSEYEDQMRDVYGSGNWTNTVRATAEGSLPFMAKASGKVTTSAGVTAGGRSGNTEGQSVSNSNERGYTTSGSSNESQSFGSATSEGRGQSINSSYALGNVNSNSVNESAGVSSNRTWNLSETESTSEVVSENNRIAENLTISDSQSETTTQSFSGFIPRGRYGIFYRQTTRWVRRAEVRSFNQCGVSQHVGELQFNEYNWAPDLAIAQSCEDRPPPPNLPESACFIQPCGG